jgi:hypothetical protein
VNGPAIAVLTASWTGSPESEMSMAVRSIAGALTRLGPVDVFVPGDGPRVADGAFDLVPVGGSSPETGRVGAGPRWPSHASRAEPAAGSYAGVLVEAGDDGAFALASSVAPGAPVWSVGRADGEGPRRLAVDLPAGPSPTASLTGLYARVHPGASTRRHYGLRSIPEYLLVLGDRPGAPTPRSPSAVVRWALAGFARRYVVVVDGGSARVWRSRSCVAEFGVHTRMDLWILMARAIAVVDLLPGDVFARECVESLRLGVPVAVPADSTAEGLARSGGGLAFGSTAELLSCIDALFDPGTRETLASDGRAAADHWYGDPDALVSRLAAAVAPRAAPEERRGRA